MVEAHDFSVAEVADEDVVAEEAEVVGRYDCAPGGIQGAAGGEAFDQRAVGVEDVDEAVGAGTLTSSWASAFLEGVGDVELVVDGGDVERGVAGGEGGVFEGWRLWATGLKVGVEDVDVL